MDLPHFEMKYPRLNPVYKPFIDKYVFSEFVLNHTNKECAQLSEDLRDVTMDVNGLRKLESNFVTDIYGHPFTWSWYDATLNVWDEIGGTLVAKATFDTNNRQKQMNKIIERMEEFTCGWIHCSDCDAKVKYHDETGGRYFAGIYCQKCWDGKWKAIEAKENYN